MFLSQPGSAISPSYHWAAHDGFDRIGDQVARLQAERHPVGAHRHPVGHPDRIESHPDHALLGHTFFDVSRQIQQVHVAGIALVPNAADANLRLVHVLAGHPRRVKHRLGCTLRLGLCDFGTVGIQRLIHRATQ